MYRYYIFSARETITGIQGVAGFTEGASDLRTTQGSISISGTTLSINNINTESVTISNESTSFSQFLVKQWTITYTVHTHSFNYSANGATITATCTADGCTLPESSAGAGDHVATLTISASGGTYDGTTAYGATITDANSIQGDAKVPYQKKTDGSYGTATETAPTDAGDYKAIKSILSTRLQ